MQKDTYLNDGLKKELIHSLPFIHHFDQSEIDSLIQFSQFIHVKKGTILRNGHLGRNEILYIVKGRVRVVLLSSEGKEVTIRILSEDDLLFNFESPDIFDSARYTSEVDVDTDILRIIVSDSIYQNHYLHLMEFVIKQFKNYFDVLSNSLLQTLATNLQTRIAELLLNEAKKRRNNELSFTHAQIASYLNSSREQVSRILGQFADDYLIELGYGKIRIIDEKRLKEYLIEN